jgi:hypothetical protein
MVSQKNGRLIDKMNTIDIGRKIQKVFLVKLIGPK